MLDVNVVDVCMCMCYVHVLQLAIVEIFHVLPSIEELICLLNVVEGASFFHRQNRIQTREQSSLQAQPITTATVNTALLALYLFNS